jgi:excisionase family DNA binding protein
MNCEALIDSKEAATILNISPTKLKRMAQAAEIPALRIGNRWKFRASWLDQWLNSRVASAGHPRPTQIKESQ